MPIKIKADLPARAVLEKENVFVMTEQRAQAQDIRPLKIAIVNLMPTKIATETQLLRMLANTPLQIDISLVNMDSHTSSHVSEEHLDKFYIPSSEVFNRKFDGMIITGAPVEQLPFEDVDYWDDLKKIMDYAKENVYSTLFICWGSQAGLYHFYNIQKKEYGKKKFGIFNNIKVEENEPLMRGFNDIFGVPTSRYTTIEVEQLKNNPDLKVLATMEDGEPVIIKSKDNRQIFMSGHLEYDTETLDTEYKRDIGKGIEIDVPVNYYPDNDPKKKPLNSWRSTAHLFYSNWLNYYVYQETPYEL